jgi:hypothetical protein
MDALIKDESMDFATLNFRKVEKNPEITPFFVSKRHFPPCERVFLWEKLQNNPMVLLGGPLQGNALAPRGNAISKSAIYACDLFVTPDHSGNRDNRFRNFKACRPSNA